MARFKVDREPWATYVQNRVNNEYAPICDEALNFDPEFVHDLVKASGLKSNKRRHIKKRFRILIHDALIEGMKEWQKSN